MPIKWLTYQSELGNSGGSGKVYKIFDLYQLSTQLNRDQIIASFNLTSSEQTSFDNTLGYYSGEFDLTDLQVHYLDLSYVGSVLRDLPHDQQKTVANYLQGVAYMNENVRMNDLYQLHSTNQANALAETFTNLLLIFYGLSIENLQAMYGYPDAQILNNTVVNDVVRQQIRVGEATMSNLFRLATRKGIDN